MKDKDIEEWGEVLDLLLNGHETVMAELSNGKFMTVTETLFNEMVQEINTNRIKNGDMKEGVELIVLLDEQENAVIEGLENENSDVDSES